MMQRGKVVSNKMTSVVAVRVERLLTHPLYKKKLRRSRSFLAQTKEPLSPGDVVEITETRPISRRVRFVVSKVLTRAEVLPVIAEEKTGREKKVKVKKVSEDHGSAT